MMKIKESTGYLLLAHAVAAILFLAQAGWLQVAMAMGMHLDPSWVQNDFENFTIVMSITEILYADVIVILGLLVIDLGLILKPYIGRYHIRVDLIEKPKDDL